MADIVGFSSNGVHVALSTGTSFSPSSLWLAEFGTSTDLLWTDNDSHPRMAGDFNGDGFMDIMGCTSTLCYVALNNRLGGLNSYTNWTPNYGSFYPTFTSQNLFPRLVGDINGDGLWDIYGFGPSNTELNFALSTGSGFRFYQNIDNSFNSGSTNWGS